MVSPVRIGYLEEWDRDFIRWSANLLRSFLEDGSVVLVRQDQSPDLFLSSIWRKQPMPNRPVVLVSNENWRSWPGHEPLTSYKAVIGLYPPEQPCNFIAYPFIGVHLDMRPEQLYRAREHFLAQPKTHFCCFISSSPKGPLAIKRMALFEEINRWKRVDSGGTVLNNIGHLVPKGPAALAWIAQYRFMICLENFKEPQYITEKPFQSWFAATVPIYDGGCVDEVNQDAIINASGEDVLDQLCRLEEQPDRYEAKRRAALVDAPISLDVFEKQFRVQVLGRAA